MQWHSNKGIIMRFLKGIFLFGITIALCPPATAVTKCVKLYPSNTQCTNVSGNNTLDWSATCTNGGSSIKITGVAGCSSQYGGTTGETRATISSSNNVNDNKYCWCKMTSPAVSQWVYFYFYMGPSATSCVERCASDCSEALKSNTNFINAMFNNLSD